MSKYWIKKTLGFLFFLSVFSGIISCETDPNVVTKSYEDLKDANWYLKQIPTFSFEIKDETIPYDIYLMVRNGSQYPYNNLYVNRYIYDEKGNNLSSRLEEMILFDTKSGKPLGQGLGDIFDHKIISSKNFKFPHKGKYTIKIKQYMRQDPLPYLMSIGISVEKSQGNKQ